MKDAREKMYKAPLRPFSAKGVAALALAAVLTAGVASCRKDKEATPSSPTGVPCFRATVEAHTGDGKTHLDERQVKWDEGDRVAVYNKNGEYGPLEAKEVNEGGTSATLYDMSGEFSFEAPYKAVYPRPSYPEDACEGEAVNNVPLNAGGVQAYAEKGFPKDGNPMAAYTGTGKADATLGFKNLCGLLKVSVKGDGNPKVKSISITSNDKEDALWGNCRVSFEDGEGKIEKVVNDADNKHVVTMECGNMELSEPETATDFYFVLPPGVLKKGFTMEVVDEHGLAMFRKKASKDTEIAANRITKMDEITVTKAANLAGNDNSERANCYIVNAAGDYMFPCNVKGNGVPPADDSNCMQYLSDEQKSSALSGYKTASLVWQTYNDGTANPNHVVDANSVKLEGDYVHFTADTHDGNALIAVKDMNGDILWSWHIWRVSDYDPANPAKDYTAFGLGDNPPLMDRNLGALSTVPNNRYTIGLLYQWGRKDPLMGSQYYGSGSTALMTTAPINIGNKTFQTIDDASSNVANTIKQPDAFAFQVNTVSTDWFSGTGALSNGLWDEAKTMYDPCPYGWKVPPMSISIPGGEGGTPTTFYTWGTYTSDEVGNWEKFDNHGRMFLSIAATPTPESGKEAPQKSYYPAAGRRISGGTLDIVGNNGYYWSTVPQNYNMRRLHLRVADVEPITGSNPRVQAFSVRPVKYQEQAPSGK